MGRAFGAWVSEKATVEIAKQGAVKFVIACTALRKAEFSVAASRKSGGNELHTGFADDAPECVSSGQLCA